MTQSALLRSCAVACALVAIAPQRAQAQSCPLNLSCNAGGPGAAALAATTTNTSTGTYGVSGMTKSTSTGAAGVFGVDGTGGFGGCGPSLPSAGIRGESWSGDGVIGLNTNSTLGTAGVSGYNSSIICNPGAYVYGQLAVQRTVSGVNRFYGVWAGGDFGGTGAKYFVEPHPADPSREIRYISLEGPEAGTYFRGAGRIVHGSAVIEVPESFRMVTDEDGLTVVVTPVAQMAVLAVMTQDLNRIVVHGSKDVKFNYLVNGVRRAFRGFEAVGPNIDFVPIGPDDSRFFTLPVESQRRLVETEIFTADGKVNLVKAH